MRVALVCPYSWSVPGGVQSHVDGLARALRTRGHEVDVIAPAEGPVTLPGFVRAGRSLPILDNGSWVRVALDPAAAARTARIVRSRGYDLLHLHEPMIPAVCLIALLTASAPLVGTFHMYASRPRWYRPFSPLARRALPRLGARIAVSQAALRHVSRTCPGEYHVIPNGLDVAAFDVPGERRNGSRLLFIGRPDPRKGLHVLLEAFAQLPDSLTLDLAGVSPAELRKAAGWLADSAVARIRAHGRVSDDERRRLLGLTDVLCAPSLEGESFGIVLVEGMAAGLPVVASAIPGYVDVLPPECGRLVRPGDPRLLADSLGELFDAPALRRRLGDAGRREAARYDWSRVCAEIVDVYEQVLRGGGRPAGDGRSSDGLELPAGEREGSERGDSGESG